MTLVLVIDDEPLYHKMVARALLSLNCEVETAQNGLEGISRAKNLLPDVIITDVMMPDITGYEVTRLLRREPQFAHTPILVLTAQAGLENKLQSFESGADDHMNKPFEPDELAARVSALLRRAEAMRSPKPQPVAAEMGRVIAVQSLRGGTGSSSLAVNLGICLASLWTAPSILLDLSMTAGQVALMLNMSLKRTWADVSRFAPGDLDMEALNSVIGRHESGLSFIAAPTFPTEAEMLRADTFGQALRLLRSHYDYVVVDLPHDFSELTLRALDAADLILMVGAPDMASVRALSAAIDTYKKLNYSMEKIKLVLNATFPKLGLSKEKIEAALGMTATVVIPYTSDVFVQAINLGKPIVWEDFGEPVSGLMEDLAFYISKDTHKKSRPANPTEAWKRVYKRFSSRKK